MSGRDKTDTLGERVETEAGDDLPDLRALVRAVKRRDRQFVIARLLVEEFARADGEEPALAWRRYRRALAIERISALGKGELSKADVPGLMAEAIALAGHD